MGPEGVFGFIGLAAAENGQQRHGAGGIFRQGQHGVGAKTVHIGAADAENFVSGDPLTAFHGEVGGDGLQSGESLLPEAVEIRRLREEGRDLIRIHPRAALGFRVSAGDGAAQKSGERQRGNQPGGGGDGVFFQNRFAVDRDHRLEGIFRITFDEKFDLFVHMAEMRSGPAGN